MLTEIHPKLPMRDKLLTRNFYLRMGFEEIGDPAFMPYLMVRHGAIEIHFFESKQLDPKENDGQVYIRTNNIEELYRDLIGKGIAIHTNGALEIKPWRQREFSILDPDNNLLTFGQAL